MSDLLKLASFLLCIRESAQRAQDLLNNPRPLLVVEGKNLPRSSLVNEGTTQFEAHASDEG